jgi:bifunctional non-homologous end joining protein LigD
LLTPPPPRGAGRPPASAYAKRLAGELSREHPDLVVATMSKQARPGKVFIDWSQNNSAKTTIAPYSLRGTERPQVSTPLLWEEVAELRKVPDAVFGPVEVLSRLDEHGDLLAPMRRSRQRLPSD